MQQNKVSVKYFEENSVFGRVSYYLLLEFFWEGVGWGGRLFEAGRLLTFSAFSMGAYSRWALIRGWALIRINTVIMLVTMATPISSHVKDKNSIFTARDEDMIF